MEPLESVLVIPSYLVQLFVNPAQEYVIHQSIVLEQVLHVHQIFSLRTILFVMMVTPARITVPVLVKQENALDQIFIVKEFVEMESRLQANSVILVPIMAIQVTVVLPLAPLWLVSYVELVLALVT
jgi:hypothetical protein